MHTFRPLYTTLDIARTGKVVVKRDNCDELLAIKSGQFEYDELLQKADKLMSDMEMAFVCSLLQDIPNTIAIIIDTLINVCDTLYGV